MPSIHSHVNLAVVFNMSQLPFSDLGCCRYPRLDGAFDRFFHRLQGIRITKYYQFPFVIDASLY